MTITAQSFSLNGFNLVQGDFDPIAAVQLAFQGPVFLHVTEPEKEGEPNRISVKIGALTLEGSFDGLNLYTNGRNSLGPKRWTLSLASCVDVPGEVQVHRFNQNCSITFTTDQPRIHETFEELQSGVIHSAEIPSTWEVFRFDFVYSFDSDGGYHQGLSHGVSRQHTTSTEVYLTPSDVYDSEKAQAVQTAMRIVRALTRPLLPHAQP